MRLVRVLRVIGAVLSMTVAVQLDDALACSCAPRDSPCAALEQAGAVIFVGTALEVSAPTQAFRGAPGELVVRARFAVAEVFRGGSGPTMVVTTADNEGSCGYAFSVGETYLVHAHRTAEGLQTSICTHTAPLSAARDDLELLREAGRGAVRSRLHGNVLLLLSRMNGTLLPAIAGGLPGITVVASAGAMKYEATTDDTGVYRFVGLAPGQYTVRANTEAPIKPMFDREVTARLDGCSAEADLYLTAASLSGTIRRHDGAPAPGGLRVTVVDAAHVSPSRSAIGFTDADGRWQVDGLPDGQYLVGVNIAQAPTALAPFPTVWYPGVTASGSRQEISLRDQRPRQLDFTLPPPMPLRTIGGIVLDAAGLTVRDADVSLIDGEFPDEIVGRASTDPKGRFSIDVVVGRSLLARARTYTRGGAVESDAVEISQRVEDGALTLVLWKTATRGTDRK